MLEKMSSPLALFILFLFFLSVNALAQEKIDINTASLEDLVKIIHIGETRARELISLRPFETIDDLSRIKGLGPKRIEDIKKQGLAQIEEQTGQSEQKQELKLEPSPIIYPSGVIINEILPSPEGPDEKEEWIELFNKNGFSADLTGWRIRDTAGVTTNYTIPEKTNISALGFFILKRPDSKITLNNEADGIELLQPDGKIADGASFGKSPIGQSYNRAGSNWLWSSILTPGETNIVPSPSAKKSANALSNSSPQNLPSETGLASIRKPLTKIYDAQQKPASSFLFFGALLLAVSLAILILFLKKKIKRVDF